MRLLYVLLLFEKDILHYNQMLDYLSHCTMAWPGFNRFLFFTHNQLEY